MQGGEMQTTFFFQLVVVMFSWVSISGHCCYNIPSSIQVSGKSGDFITLYVGLNTNVLTVVSLFPDSDAEAASIKRNPNFDRSLKRSAVESTFLLIQSSDCSSSCTWLPTWGINKWRSFSSRKNFQDFLVSSAEKPCPPFQICTRLKPVS